MRKHQFSFSPHAHPPEQPQEHSFPEQPQEQGAPFLMFRHTASAISAPTATSTMIDPFDISQSPFYILHFPGRTTIQMHQRSTRIATAVQNPNPPPAQSMPI